MLNISSEHSFNDFPNDMRLEELVTFRVVLFVSLFVLLFVNIRFKGKYCMIGNYDDNKVFGHAGDFHYSGQNRKVQIKQFISGR